MPDHARVRIVLTPEQREQVRRASGQEIEAILLEADGAPKQDTPLHARWRLSLASGIPRQAWVDESQDPPHPT